MSHHYPEVHKIIMKAMEDQDYEVSSSIDNEFFRDKLTINIVIPSWSRYPITISRECTFSEVHSFRCLSELIDPKLSVHHRTGWFIFCNDYYFNFKKLFIETDILAIDNIMKEEFNCQKIKLLMDNQTRAQKEDARIAASINGKN